MALPYVNANNYTVLGTNLVDTGAARHDQYRIQAILAESSQNVPAKKPTTRELNQKYFDTIEAPRANRALALGTAQSSAHVGFQGRTFTLPPVSSAIEVPGPTLGGLYHGLGVTHAVEAWYSKSVDNILSELSSIQRENRAAQDKSKKLFSRAPKPTHVIDRPNEILFHQKINRALAESRIPLTINEDTINDMKKGVVFRHPSSASGNYLAEMQAWSDAHWHGVPEVKNRDWTRDIIKDFPRTYSRI